MAHPSNRENFKQYCLRKLGYPAVKVNVTEEQIDDRIDEALDMYQNFHFDAVERVYLKHQVTSGDISNNYITMADSVIGVSRIFQIGTENTNGTSMFDITYQWKLNDMPSFTSPMAIDYYMMKRHLRLLDQLFQGEIGISFQRHARRIYIDFDWVNDTQAGNWLIFEANRVLDPNDFPKIWNDAWLKEYVTALIKRQWATNLSKFPGFKLPGGFEYNAKELFTEADEEVKRLESVLQETYQWPAMMLTG